MISYAATIALKHYNRTFVESLGSHLRKLYPLHQQEDHQGQGDPGTNPELVHIHFPPIRQYYGEMLPLLITIFFLFLYYYFSCNKIEVGLFKHRPTGRTLVKSLLGMQLKQTLKLRNAKNFDHKIVKLSFENVKKPFHSQKDPVLMVSNLSFL